MMYNNYINRRKQKLLKIKPLFKGEKTMEKISNIEIKKNKKIIKLNLYIVDCDEFENEDGEQQKDFFSKCWTDWRTIDANKEKEELLIELEILEKELEKMEFYDFNGYDNFCEPVEITEEEYQETNFDIKDFIQSVDFYTKM